MMMIRLNSSMCCGVDMDGLVGVGDMLVVLVIFDMVLFLVLEFIVIDIVFFFYYC